ncbi:PREDICTED: uncharacterized protein LOC104804992 isoform X2 [Tarenaya hassleriana]|uniref:uncharacterized protein LOC104804992 isoform X2 n=1 Tax=Tarenaya hassleriana TaxID=28532 RepID=UPI00053CA721|nr:PREDICTED: uncharacterized protein LOC104804992 isoform X2 [Tarenaya hassleriana]
MELEQVSSCCSSSSPSPSSSAASDSSPLGEGAADRTELEAAEALADLAQLALVREKVVESAAKWGRKGKRVRKRVKNESPPCNPVLKPADSEPPASDPAEFAECIEPLVISNALGNINEKLGSLERAVKEEQEAQAIGRDLTIVPVKTEVDEETPKQLLASTLKCRSSGGGRWRQNLSEAEKEERRIRRILANRESARQTIRRRQALCEELNRKASDLSYENAQLKREKDWALKEFQSLEMINKHLKEQLSRSIKPEAKEHDEAPKASQVETAASAPFCCYNQHPFQLFCWSPVIQSSSSAALPQNGLTVPSMISARASTKVEPSKEQEKPGNDDGMKPPFYIVPCPWFLPPPGQTNGVQTVVPYELENIQEGCSLRHVDNIQSLPSRLPSITKEGDSTRGFYDLNKSAPDIPAEGEPSFFFKHEEASQPANGPALISLPEESRGYVGYSSSKRLVDSVAAADARKRRKELTRLKNLHSRQCRMQV